MLSRKLRVPSGTGKPHTGFETYYNTRTGVSTNNAIAKVKGVVTREGTPFDFSVTTGLNQVITITLDTSRQWMDLLMQILKRDKRRKHRWVSNRPTVIGEWLWKDLNSQWDWLRIKVRAPVDNTLPPEGAMTEKELEIIYGK